MNKSQIFRNAHRLAKSYVGNYSACFALALTEVYASMKEAKQTEEFAYKFIRETEKAVLVAIPYIANCNMTISLFQTWVPKSQVTITEKTIEMPTWLACKIAAQASDRSSANFSSALAYISRVNTI